MSVSAVRAARCKPSADDDIFQKIGIKPIILVYPSRKYEQ